ncbi:MAG TPA: hypothetical protein VLT36_11810 [Candidatus Dormibacteraeota bacterium]|nr:hypothetical protein [Candidatus Dormibacteraeota bacterium]
MRTPPPGATRVEQSTRREVNQKISRRTQATVASAAVSLDHIERRLAELDREWDIERALQTNFGIINVASIILGGLVARPWFLLTGVAAGFMAKHALEGWCPPVPVLRRLGFRTAREIAQERYALKALRGDFEDVDASKPHQALAAAAIDHGR